MPRHKNGVGVAFGYILTVVIVAISLAALLAILVLAVKALWWVLTC